MSYRFPDDFFAAREHSRYQTPIPSRQHLLYHFWQAQKPLAVSDLKSLFRLRKKADLESLSTRLEAMIRNHELVLRKKKYAVAKTVTFYQGKVIAHRDGYGFVVIGGGRPDLFLPAFQMQGVMHQDEVLVYKNSAAKRFKNETKVVHILQRAKHKVTGTFQLIHKKPCLVPTGGGSSQEFVVLEGGAASDVAVGDLIVGTIKDYPIKMAAGTVQLHKVLGQAHQPGIETQMAIEEHHIPDQFSQETLAESKKIPNQVRAKDRARRHDLRDYHFVTIDGADAKDFDDAVCCTWNQDGTSTLYVAIADVSYYVRPGSNLDSTAKERGNSVYFPNKVVPMLPESLSNEMCSLRPEVDRLVLVCELHFDKHGEREIGYFYQAVIHSKARLTYRDVGAYLQEGCDCVPKHVQQSLLSLHQLYQLLLQQRQTRGALEFRTTETAISFNKSEKIDSIQPVVRNDAHKMIEEFMLAANVATADFMLEHDLPTLFRNHQAPNADKLKQLKSSLHELGLKLQPKKELASIDLAHLLEQTCGTPQETLVNSLVLRSMQQACYESKHAGHFGLAYPAYAHFTSPIRRYADLLTHRAISEFLETDKVTTVSNKHLNDIGEHLCHTERRADEASRQVAAWLKCVYLQDKIGNVYAGTVTAVTHFGLFIMLDDLHVEGLVHISQLGTDYYIYSESKHQLTGETSGEKFAVGTKVKVQVAGVQLQARKIDLALVCDV